MRANRFNTRFLPSLSLKGKVLLTLMGGVFCAEAAMAYQQIAYAINPCKVEAPGLFITAEGGCKDVRSGRVWSRNTMSPERGGSFYTFAAAKSYCSNLVEGGYDDWRMATRDELKTAYANGAGNYLDVFWVTDHSGAPPYEYDYHKWSSTTITVKGQRRGEYAYVVDLKTGVDTYQWWTTNGGSWTDLVCTR